MARSQITLHDIIKTLSPHQCEIGERKQEADDIPAGIIAHFDIDPKTCSSAKGSPKKETYLDAVLNVVDQDYYYATAKQKRFKRRDMKTALAADYDKHFEEFGYKSLPAFRKKTVKAALHNPKGDVDQEQAIQEYLMDFLGMNRFIIILDGESVANIEFYPAYYHTDRVANVEAPTVVLYRQGVSGPFRPILNAAGDHSYFTVESDVFVQKLHTALHSAPAPSPGPKSETELKPMKQYKLSELQELANTAGIDIRRPSEKTGKPVLKKKAELYSDLQQA